MALRTISLCAGIGGIDIGLAEWCRTVCYVERETFAASVLVARMEDASLDPAPVWDDLTTFEGAEFRGAVDLITGGYPCQPFSVAGNRRGADDERHLWPHVRDILRDTGAPLAFFENVPGHVSLGLSDVLGDLASLGFDAEWTCNTASEIGSSMEGERLFILASANGVRESQSRWLFAKIWRRDRDEGEELGKAGRWGSPRLQPESIGRGDKPPNGRAGCEELEPTSCLRLGEGRAEPARLERSTGTVGARRAVGILEHEFPPGPEDEDGWRRFQGAIPILSRGTDGLPRFVDRADRVRALGNAVVPQQARSAFIELGGRLACRWSL